MVETNTPGLHAVAARLAALLARVSPQIPGQAPDSAEQAEITTVLSVSIRLQAYLKMV
jgi:hypothetical protein